MSEKDIEDFVFDELDYMQHFLCSNFGLSTDKARKIVSELVNAWV